MAGVFKKKIFAIIKKKKQKNNISSNTAFMFKTNEKPENKIQIK